MRELVFEALGAAPRVVERLLRVFPSHRLDDHAEDLGGSKRFTAREVIAHLADHEQVVLDRIRVANMRPGATFDWYDPDERAKDHHYSDKDAFHEAEVYESRRVTTLEYLQGLSEEDFKKTFTLNNGTTMTIDEYLVRMMVHDMYHVEQLSHYFANEVATIS